MRWPMVWRSRYEALAENHLFCQVRYEDLEKRYQELKEHADKLLDGVFASQAEEAKKSNEQPDPVQEPRRLLSRDIRERATAAMTKNYQERAKA
jgi:hypothetical protein